MSTVLQSHHTQPSHGLREAEERQGARDGGGQQQRGREGGGGDSQQVFLPQTSGEVSDVAGAPGDVMYYLVGSCDGDYLISRGQMSELFNDI